MKAWFTFFLLTICSLVIHAQNITGIWRGYFSSGMSFYRQEYKYEVQINELTNKALEGVTYSYRTTVFYGKANLHGIFMDKNNNVIIKEDSLVEVKMMEKTDPCLMTCYLEYYKNGSTEVLEGTFTSINLTDKTDCGAGNVYLERVAESDFKKEDFLVKKKPPVINHSVTPAPLSKNSQTSVNPKDNAAIKRLQTALGLTPDGVAGPKTLVALKAKVPAFTGSKITNDNADNLISQIKKTGLQNNKIIASKPVAIKPTTKPNNTVTGKNDTISKQPNTATINPSITAPNVKPQILPPPPAVLKERENNLVRTITTTSADIKIDLYDNGEIDGDTISVYHNNELIVNKKGLTADPITIHITADVNNSHHEFVMVANNLGKIPPNTALMVLTTGGKRYEVDIVSTKQKNAKIIIDYKAGTSMK